MNSAPDNDEKVVAADSSAEAGNDPVEPAESIAATPSRPRLMTRLKSHVWSWRSVAAVGIATLVLGGLGGVGIGFALDHDGPDGHRDGAHGPHGPGNFQPGQNMPQGGFGPPMGQMPGR